MIHKRRKSWWEADHILPVVEGGDSSLDNMRTLEALAKLRPYFKADGVVTAGNASGIFCGLTLRIVKICRNGNYRFSYICSKIIFCSLLHFLKDHGR